MRWRRRESRKVTGLGRLIPEFLFEIWSCVTLDLQRHIISLPSSSIPFCLLGGGWCPHHPNLFLPRCFWRDSDPRAYCTSGQKGFVLADPCRIRNQRAQTRPWRTAGSTAKAAPYEAAKHLEGESGQAEKSQPKGFEESWFFGQAVSFLFWRSFARQLPRCQREAEGLVQRAAQGPVKRLPCSVLLWWVSFDEEILGWPPSSAPNLHENTSGHAFRSGVSHPIL